MTDVRNKLGIISRGTKKPPSEGLFCINEAIKNKAHLLFTTPAVPLSKFSAQFSLKVNPPL